MVEANIDVEQPLQIFGVADETETPTKHVASPLVSVVAFDDIYTRCSVIQPTDSATA